MPQSNQSDSETEATVPDTTPRRNMNEGSKKMTDYEIQRMKRIEENKARMKAMGLDKLTSSFISSAPISQTAKNKGKRKVGVEDDDEYNPSDNDEESNSSCGSDGDSEDDEFLPKIYPSVYCKLSYREVFSPTTPSRKISKISGNSDFIDEDEALMKAIALSLQESTGVLDVANETPPSRSNVNGSSAENSKRKQGAQKDDSGKRKRKNLFTSRVQMTEDELILHFFQFDEVGKGGINTRDLRRVAASHDFIWKDEEMEHMIQFFDSDGDGKLSLEDFTKIVERCNMRQRSENTERASVAS